MSRPRGANPRLVKREALEGDVREQLVARDMDEFEESITLIQHAHGVCLFTDCDISLIELLMSDCSSATRLATSLMHVEPVTCLG